MINWWPLFDILVGAITANIRSLNGRDAALRRPLPFSFVVPVRLSVRFGGRDAVTAYPSHFLEKKLFIFWGEVIVSRAITVPE
jgi:hypothetical protein